MSFLLAHPEQAGALLGQLGPEDFQGERARCTWMLAEKLHSMGIPLSPQALYDLTGLAGVEKHFERLTGGMDYLDSLAEDAPEAAFIPHAVRMVAGAAHRRKIIGLMGELQALAGSWHGDNTELDEKVAAVLAYIQGGMKKKNPAGRLSFTAREMAEGAGRGPIWLVPNLLLQGGLNLLAGEVSSGKTFLALDLAIAVASGGVPWRMISPSPVGEGCTTHSVGPRCKASGAQSPLMDLQSTQMGLRSANAQIASSLAMTIRTKSRLPPPCCTSAWIPAGRPCSAGWRSCASGAASTRPRTCTSTSPRWT